MEQRKSLSNKKGNIYEILRVSAMAANASNAQLFVENLHLNRKYSNFFQFIWNCLYISADVEGTWDFEWDPTLQKWYQWWTNKITYIFVFFESIEFENEQANLYQKFRDLS